MGLKAVLVCLVAGVAGAPGAEPAPESAPAGTSAVEKLAHDIDRARRDAAIPAAAVVLVRRGQPAIMHTWGATPDTPFRVGSISKSFTALTMLTLAARGRVDLDAPARRIVGNDSYRNPFAAATPVRIRHLLELTAGFTDLSGSEFDDNRFLSLADALRLNPDNRTARWPPGLQHSYTNSTPGLTALAIERLTGKSFEVAAQELVLAPLRMPRASFLPVDGLPGGFRDDGRTPIPYWNVTFRAFGGLNVPAVEFARFLDALLDRGTVGPLTPDTREALFFPRTGLAASHGLRVGYGAGAYGRVSHGHVFYGHGGDADGYRSRYGVLPDAGRAYFVVINTDNPGALRTMVRSIEAALTADLPAPVPPPAASMPLAVYAGTYYPSSTRFGLDRWRSGEGRRLTVAVADHNGTAALRAQRTRRTTTLIPVAPGLFRRPGDPVATVAFAKANSGALYLQGELGNYFRIGAPCPDYAPPSLADACAPPDAAATTGTR